MALIILSSCGTVPIYNDRYCAYDGDGASCFYFLSDDTKEYTEEQWQARQYGQICTDDDPDNLGAAYLHQKATIEKLCSIAGKCTAEEKKRIEAIFQRTESFNKKFL